MGRLPPETLAYLAHPDGIDLQGSLPPGLDTFDPTALLLSATTIVLGQLGAQGAHELGHRLAAAFHKARAPAAKALGRCTGSISPSFRCYSVTVHPLHLLPATCIHLYCTALSVTGCLAGCLH